MWLIYTTTWYANFTFTNLGICLCNVSNINVTPNISNHVILRLILEYKWTARYVSHASNSYLTNKTISLLQFEHFEQDSDYKMCES